MKGKFIQKIGFVLFTPILLAVISITFFYAFLCRTSTATGFVDVAGRQRMLSQRLFAYSSGVQLGHEDDRGKLRETILTFDHALTVLGSGGEERGYVLPPPPKELLDEISEAKSLWEGFKYHLLLVMGSSINDPEAQKSYAFIHANIGLLTEATDRILIAYVARNKVIWNQMFFILTAILILDIVVFLFAFWAIRQYIAERTLAEKSLKDYSEKLRHVNEFNETILKGIPFGMDIVDEEGNILYLNEKLAAIVGKDALGKKCFALYKDNRKQCDNCSLKKGIDAGKISSIETEGVLGGRMFRISHCGISYKGRRAVIEIFEDITEKRQIEEELAQTEKLYEVGQLASGVAHEVRNPLGIILQGVNYMEKCISPAQSDIFKTLGMMKDSIKRADTIIRSLFDFSKTTELVLLPENVNSILEESLELVKQRIKFERIEIVKEASEDIPKVLVDKNRIEQVLINLFLNASDAMPEGGKIVIRSYDKKLETVRDGVGRRNGDSFKPGERAVIVEVEDTGLGIPEENLRKIFNPFFTTKGPIGGAGLGLSVSRNIIELHRGLIDVKSQVGKGTKVTITLRVA